MHEIFDHFCKALAERLTHENRISDVLYAAMQASDIMYKIIATRFEFPLDDSAEIQREYHHILGRPDFFIRFERSRMVYILEVKLYDRNYHYPEYCQISEAGSVCKVGILTAHRPELALDGWKKVYWNDLVEDMEKTGDRFMGSLATFFKEAIGMKELKPINFADPKAMLYVNRAIAHVITQFQSNTVSVERGTAPTTFQDDRSGYEYGIKAKSSEMAEAWIRFQLVYGDDFEGVWLWLSKRANKHFEKIVGVLKQRYRGELKQDGSSNAYYVHLNDDDYTNFLSCKDKDTQLKILTDFFNRFNDAIEEALSS